MKHTRHALVSDRFTSLPVEMGIFTFFSFRRLCEFGGRLR